MLRYLSNPINTTVFELYILIQPLCNRFINQAFTQFLIVAYLLFQQAYFLINGLGFGVEVFSYGGLFFYLRNGNKDLL
ncbi:hypothetical protein [Cecembia calidifontis]|uniref:hypothetical protein n=1 Tax=Cecembia calidifontis TaxID=1187080 RepID=UPI0013EE8569|nr:hypothetical protein [Cecembia calidifontis]